MGPLAQNIKPLRQGRGARRTIPGQHGAKALGCVLLGRGNRGGGTSGLPQQMAQFQPFGLQIGGVVVTGIHHQWHPIYNFKSITAQTGDLARIIGD